MIWCARERFIHCYLNDWPISSGELQSQFVQCFSKVSSSYQEVHIWLPLFGTKLGEESRESPIKQINVPLTPLFVHGGPTRETTSMHIQRMIQLRGVGQFLRGNLGSNCYLNRFFKQHSIVNPCSTPLSDITGAINSWTFVAVSSVMFQIFSITGLGFSFLIW